MPHRTEEGHIPDNTTVDHRIIEQRYISAENLGRAAAKDMGYSLPHFSTIS